MRKVKIILTVIVLALSTLNCSSKPSKPNLRVQGELQEQVRKTEDSAEKTKWIFQEELLKLCEDNAKLEDDSMDSLARAAKISKIEKQECLLRHNALVNEIRVKQSQ